MCIIMVFYLNDDDDDDDVYVLTYYSSNELDIKLYTNMYQWVDACVCVCWCLCIERQCSTAKINRMNGI